MIARLTRIIGSLGAVIVLYWTYALLAVPFIEPSVSGAGMIVGDPNAPNALDAHKEQVKALAAWFSEGEWERTSPKILETSQGMLLVNNYTNMGEGRVQIIPCTMIFLPEGNFATEEERQRRAIILQAPQGAILQFDAFDLKQGKVGKLIAGKLLGAVTIRSDQREPGPQDDLQIITSDVDMSEQRFTTPQPVDFKVGPNYGHGRSLQIDMAPQGSKRGFRGMTLLQLFEDVEMHIMPGGNEIFPGGRSRAAPPGGAADAKKPSLPIEISCRGPFRFDFLTNVATFKDQVDVKRENAAGPSDQLNCQLLSMYFEPTAPRSGGVAEADKTASNLQPVRLEADGSPVVVHAHSNGMWARGQHVDYLIKSGAVTIRGEPEATVEQGGREIHARELTYQPDPSGKIGQFTATGQGWVRGARPEDKGQHFHATWTRRLYFRPYEGNYLLSLEGAAMVNIIGKGAVSAEEIYLWLRDTTPPPPAGTKTAEGRQIFTPDRLQAVGHVKIDAPQLTGDVGQLQAWFETVAPPPVAEVVPVPAARDAAPAPAMTTVSTPVAPPPVLAPASPPMAAPPVGMTPLPPIAAQPAAAPAAPVPTAEAAAPSIATATPAQAEHLAVPPADAVPQQRFHISGELMQTRVKMQGNITELSEVVVEHNVRLSETKTRLADEKPLLVMGQRLHMTMPQPKDAIVMVTGDPSYVEARGITMTSETIHLNRGRNILWTDNQGAMTFPLNRDLDGRPAGEVQIMNVRWLGQMQFDGQVARFDRHVIAEQGLRKMTTESLEVLLSRRVEFGSASGKERPEVERVTCRAGVLLESRTLEGQRLMSIDKLQTVEMTVHQPTGDLEGLGPGWVSSVRFDANQKTTPTLPGTPAKPAAAPKKPASGLSYLGVEFQRGMTGNVRRHEMHFENQVRAVYGPVATWESRLDPDQPETWGDEGALLLTDRLNVVEIASGPDQRWYELEALGGKTSVENKIYWAKCSRLTYDQSKDLLVLEGDTRSNAQLFRQLRLGAVPSAMVARKILYWPKTNRVKVDEANMLDLTIPPSTAPPKR